MTQTLEAIAILFIVWQLMTRLKKNVQISPNTKSEFQEAIDDAKDKLPSTGLFEFFKEDSSSSGTRDELVIEIEETNVPAKKDD